MAQTVTMVTENKKSRIIISFSNIYFLYSVSLMNIQYESCHVYRKMPILRAKMVAMETFAHKMVIISVINGPKLAHGENFM